MTEVEGFERTPLTLIVESRTSAASERARVLEQVGYTVLRAFDAEQAVALLPRLRPDLVVVGQLRADESGTDALAAFARLPGVRPSTPLMLWTDGSVTHEERTRAYQAGAWAILSGQPDRTELGAMLGTFVRAKQDADTAIEDTLIDPAAGCYNVRGMLLKAREVTADAARSRRPVASVAVGLADTGSLGEAEAPLLDELGKALMGSVRGGDTVGRLGAYDFVVVAPGTDPTGATALAERLLHRVDRTRVGRRLHDLGFQAGVYGMSRVDVNEIIPVDLLTRAALALRRAQEVVGGARVFEYSP